MSLGYLIIIVMMVSFFSIHVLYLCIHDLYSVCYKDH
jgi:hypothetical protein